MPDLGEQWSAALVELRGRMDRHTFDRLFRGSFLVRAEDRGESGPWDGTPGHSHGTPGHWRVAVRGDAVHPWLERYHAQVADSAALVAGRPVRVTFEVATPDLLAQYHREQHRDRPPLLPSPAPAAAAPPCRDRSQPASTSRPPAAPPSP